MRIGVPKEIKVLEYRVGLTPESVATLVADGHSVLVETNAGEGIGASDADYEANGATIAATAADVFAGSEMIVKVKEPQPVEIAMLTPKHTLYTYLHLAADRAQTEGLMASGATCIAYETITGKSGGLPLLTPMSEVAGRMSVHVGANALHKASGGEGLLLGGVAGVAPGVVVILGGGVSGTNAMQMAIGLGADVRILDVNLDRLRAIGEAYGSRVKTIYSTPGAIKAQLAEADLVVGAVLIPGAEAPKLVSADDLKLMKKGAVLVDIAIDQGGCFETSKATTHAEPTYIVDDVVHYCVANMPGAVPRTSTYALNAATISHARAIANKGWELATAADPHLAAGLNVINGKIVCDAVAEVFPDLAAKAAWITQTVVLSGTQ